jgi:hypothetical protein
MKKIILKSILFTFIMLSIILSYSYIISIIITNRNFQNHETESNLIIIKENEKFDLAFMGISHARNFSRHKNHLRIENILKKHIINFGQGRGACSVNEQFFYLDYFYKKGNSVNTIFYILTPPMLFSETLSKASNTFIEEPFKFDFFIRYLFFKNSENKGQRLFYYVRSKFTPYWLKYKPYSLERMSDKLEKIDSIKVIKGMKSAYTSDDWLYFEENCKTIERNIILANANSSKIVFIIPPALFGKWLGHEKVCEFANRMVLKYDVKFFDYSETVLEPKYYYDHHHLNTNGVVYFTEKYLKPILKK